MTHESPDVIQQVMGETQSPYSAVPLPHSESMIDTNSRSRQPSVISQVSALFCREDSQPPQDQQISTVHQVELVFETDSITKARTLKVPLLHSHQ